MKRSQETHSISACPEMMELQLALICLLASCLLPTASGTCFNGTLSKNDLEEKKSIGCPNAGEKLHVKQDKNLVYYLACSPVFTCAKGTYAFVDVKKCRVICEICEEGHFQPEETKTDEKLHPGCPSTKHGCNHDTKETCANSSVQDDTCRCDWRKGYRPQNDGCRHRCYTEEDKSCGLCVKDSICKEGEELNKTYHCIPSKVKPSPACRDVNGTNTSAPEVPSTTTTATTKSASSPVSSIECELLLVVSNSEKDTWKTATICLSSLICCCIGIGVVYYICKRYKNKKGIFPPQSRPRDIVGHAQEPQNQGNIIANDAVGDAQHFEDETSFCWKRKKSKKGPLPNEEEKGAPNPQRRHGKDIAKGAAGVAQRSGENDADSYHPDVAQIAKLPQKNALQSKAPQKEIDMQVQACDKSDRAKDGQKKETVDIPDREHSHKLEHQMKSSEPASGEETEVLLPKDPNERWDGEDSSTEHCDGATSGSHYGGKSSTEFGDMAASGSHYGRESGHAFTASKRGPRVEDDEDEQESAPSSSLA